MQVTLIGAQLMAHLELWETVDTLGNNSFSPFEIARLNTIAGQCANFEHGISRLKIIEFLFRKNVNFQFVFPVFCHFFNAFIRWTAKGSRP